MTLKEHILQQFAAVIEDVMTVISRGDMPFAEIDSRDCLRVAIRSRNILRRVCGENSYHFEEFERVYGWLDQRPKVALPRVLGILEAAYRDFNADLLYDLRDLVRAELAGDIIEQAQALLRENYLAAAAVLSGAILEDSLRKLAQKRGVPLPDRAGIEKLNTELAKASLYDSYVQKRITALADIRNRAAHGRFDGVSRDDVEDMVNWIRRFVSDHLS